MPKAMRQFNVFLQTDLGLALMAEQQTVLNRYLPSLAGYNLLQLSVQQGRRLVPDVSVGQYLQLGFAPFMHSVSKDTVRADYQHLPFVKDCIDTIILHHVLDFSIEPQQLLREADRTLQDGGHLAIIGFNPLSSWSLYRRYGRWLKPALPEHRPIRSARLTDWLSVLNYQILHHSCFFHRPAVNHRGSLEAMKCFEPVGRVCRSPFGQLYFILAKKRVLPVNPLHSSWFQRVSPARGAGVKQGQPQSYFED